jgi:hypothetical protein
MSGVPKTREIYQKLDTQLEMKDGNPLKISEKGGKHRRKND